jgi:transposase InsO family protein
MAKSKALINTSKLAVLIIWGVDGPAPVEIVAPNLCISAKYICEFAIPHMEANVKTHRPEQGLKAITFHWDNAVSHTAQATTAKISELGMNQMPHPPYSQTLSQGCSYDSPNEFFSAITDLMENLEKSLLRRVVDEWISRLHLVMESNGEDIQT